MILRLLLVTATAAIYQIEPYEQPIHCSNRGFSIAIYHRF